MKKEDLQRLKDTGNCPRGNLRGIDLGGANLLEAVLRETDLSQANLRERYFGERFWSTLICESELAGSRSQGS